MAKDQQEFGDGQDNFGNVASNAASAVKQVGKNAAKQAAAKGAEATAKAAAGVVKAGAESGKAVAGIAAGTAAGGPWGAAIAAAWSMRHTLFKVLICICLSIVFLVVLIISIPGIILDSMFAAIPTLPEIHVTVPDVYSTLFNAVTTSVNGGYIHSMAKVDRIITDGGYDREASMNALVDYAKDDAGYDTCYILAAYSASMGQKNTDKDDMISKLDAVADEMFPVTYEEVFEESAIPVSIYEDPSASDTSTGASRKYIRPTIHSFDDSVVNTAFGIDPDAQYYEFNVTYAEAIDCMASALKLTLDGTGGA